jgi:hypothetical protein
VEALRVLGSVLSECFSGSVESFLAWFLKHTRPAATSFELAAIRADLEELQSLGKPKNPLLLHQSAGA